MHVPDPAAGNADDLGALPRREDLYHLLPSLFRRGDAAGDEALRALLAVIEHELLALEDAASAQYDNWFVETCDPAILERIAALLGADLPGSPPRAYVANVLRTRRRKGTIGALEDVLHTATGWGVRAWETFPRLARTCYVAQPDPGAGSNADGTVDLRDRHALAHLDTPFNRLALRPDVRRIGPASGAPARTPHNLATVGLAVWRLKPASIADSQAYAVPGQPGCFTFDPLGRDVPLYNHPRPDAARARPTAAEHLPVPLSRALLAEDLAQDQDAQAPHSTYYGPGRALHILRDEQPVLPASVISANLSGWQLPLKPGTVAVDPERGRIAFAPGSEPETVRVYYTVGAIGDLGAGTYARHPIPPAASGAAPGPVTWQIEVAQSGTADADTLHDALAAWEHHSANTPGAHGIITVMDSALYADNQNLTVRVPPGAHLTLQAASGERPVLSPRGHWTLYGTDQTATLPNGDRVPAASLTIDGLLSGRELVLLSPLALAVHRCTLGPGISAHADAAASHLTVSHSLTGPLHLPPVLAALTVHDSVIDGGDGDAISGPAPDDVGPAATLARVTVLGAVKLSALHRATDCLFTASLRVEWRQTGSIHTSYLAPGSRTPQRIRCQPDLALAAADAAGATAAALDAIEHGLRPRFSSTGFGQPGYAQLRADCPPEIVGGAGDGGEMGAYHFLGDSARHAALRALLDEYLPLALEAGVRYES